MYYIRSYSSSKGARIKRKLHMFYNTTSTMAVMYQRLVEKNVLFMMKLLFLNLQRANCSLAFILETSMLKTIPVLIGQWPIKSNKILEEIDQGRHINSYNTSNELNVHHQTVLNNLQDVGYKKKLNVRVPHELRVKNTMNRFNICNTHNKISLNEIKLTLREAC